MTAHKFIVVAFLLLGVSVLGLGQDGTPDGPFEPPCTPSVYNPINTVTINACCNKTEKDDEINRELLYIKDLLNTMKTSLENGDYCCDQAPSVPRDCYEVQQTGQTTSGIYSIQPDGAEQFSVYCDMDTDGGGWTVFQRRQDDSVDFYLDWVAYEDGFGSLAGEHWLGNEKLYYLTDQKTYRLRVDLGDFEDETRYAVYDSVVIADASDNYRLALGSYSGDAGDALSYQNGQQFSTRDMDNDLSSGSCADTYQGAWWYNACHDSNLNGPYLGGPHTSYADGIEWKQWKGHYYSLKFTEMKLSPA